MHVEFLLKTFDSAYNIISAIYKGMSVSMGRVGMLTPPVNTKDLLIIYASIILSKIGTRKHQAQYWHNRN